MRDAPDKNPFKGVSDLLSRAAPAKRNTHFLAYVLDLFIVAIFSYLIFLGGRAIVTNTDSYKSNYANYDNEITYYQDMVVEAHLNEYLIRDEHIMADNEDLSIKMMISQILLSYEHDNPESPEFKENPLDKLKSTYTGTFYQDSFQKADFNNDYVARFLMEYVPLHNPDNELINYGEQDPKSFTLDIFKKYANKYEGIKLIFPSDNSMPYLRADIANNIYQFLIRAEGSNRNSYDDFVDYYSDMLSHYEDILFNSKSYQSVHYVDYLRYRDAITVSTDITLVISIILAYYLVVFTPQMIFRDGRSLGKIILRIAVINVDKSEVEVWKIILRSVLTALSHLFIAFFIMLFPPFNGSSSLLYLPFINLGAISISLLDIVLVIFVIASINGIFMLLTHEKRNLMDLLFKTITVDVTALDEPDYDENNE